MFGVVYYTEDVPSVRWAWIVVAVRKVSDVHIDAYFRVYAVYSHRLLIVKKAYAPKVIALSARKEILNLFLRCVEGWVVSYVVDYIDGVCVAFDEDIKAGVCRVLYIQIVSSAMPVLRVMPEFMIDS